MEKPVPKRFLARSFSNVCELAAGQLEPRTHQPRTPAGTTNPSKPPAAHPPTADQQQLATPSNFWKQCRSTSHAASRAGPHLPAAGKSRCADEVGEGHPDSFAAHRDAACVQNTATPPTPHGSPATDPPRVSSTACRGKISAKRDNSRYQPLTSLAAEVPGQHHQKHRKSKPNHPSSQPSGHQLGR